MTIREMTEQREHQTLSPWASFSSTSRGRLQEIAPCSVRTCYQRDRDRILHAKAFRRLGNKTQVFISPEGDHYRARLTHTLEVSQIARTLARGLRLNEDLTEAIALGHDLGHTPFGHAGETALNEVCPEGFRHNVQSLRIVDRIECNGKGLNLTQEVRDGILCHTGKQHAFTKEGQLIHYADRIAYINHDIDDAQRAGLLSQSDLPQDLLNILGFSHGERIDTMVQDMIAYGQETGNIGMHDRVRKAMLALRQFNFAHIYHGTLAQKEEQRAMNMLKTLYRYFHSHPQELPQEYQALMDRDSKARVVCDYIAGMTDRYSIAKYTQLFVPKSWNRMEE